ncbi:DUF2889 domain-containing protein [Sphingomonas sp. SUN039]|uniref:DUF2889 domain-containing protein n=1 Tax=Sphingomonas sp. SUN039 TaxID=2937787 RepID=UPI002164C885|nr:DUF2889 domain-containing protein [Sphingomonas sp. SUN039]UVO52675.1 DUF2889 domain-containing protein [Sphingomonas sp. SUN039]
MSTGFRRRFRITPRADSVTAAVEDDFHCMAVTLAHDGTTIASVDAVMDRWPWTTCPGATTELAKTFTGTALAEVARRGLKNSNCTHLYDLAVFAAAHAREADATIYDVFVGDKVAGRKHCEIRRNDAVVLDWAMEHDVLVTPETLAGTHVMQLRDWIASLDPATREAARVLQWASLIAHGRDIPLADQSDATRMPPNCFTFQPDRAKRAQRTGEIVDFSDSARRPLDHFDGRRFAR